MQENSPNMFGHSVVAKRDKEDISMKLSSFAAFAAAALFLPAIVWADADDAFPTRSIPTASDHSQVNESSASQCQYLENDPIFADEAQTQAAETPATPQKGLPLPFHVIEGYGGGAITPIAYLVNPPLGNQSVGLPSAAFSYVNLGQKSLESYTLTENLFGRVELGFGADELDLGELPKDIRNATGVDIHRNDVWLYNVNARGLIIPENSFDSQWVPALTGGVHYKYNDGIADINNKLGGALTSIGYNNKNGFDFTLTGSKTIPSVFGRPLILSAGGRLSEGAQLGFLGFADHYNASFEGNVVYVPTNWLVVAYEFRGKRSPYGQIPGLIGKEDDWHAFDVSWLVNSHIDLTAGYGIFGVLANARADSAFWIQLKYEL
jgi:hypothetical protein